MNRGEILVLGAGVSGLSTGILLQKEGYAVTIWTKDLPPNVTSNKAAAVWYPYLCSPREKAIPWARTTFEYLQAEMLPNPQSGCCVRTTTELLDTLQPDPWWKDAFPGVITRPSKEDLPEGYADGYRFDGIVIDTDMYMEFIMKKFMSLGGSIILREIEHIQQALGESNVVINCTGLGSRTLLQDEEVYPVRGQMIRVKPNGFKEVIFDAACHNRLTAVVPRIEDIVLGTTVQENNCNTEVDPKDTEDILRKIPLIAPTFGPIEIIEESVGLRPARASVRLEAESYGERTVIHNYGHGGAGFTLSWGCAQDVVEIVNQILVATQK